MNECLCTFEREEIKQFEKPLHPIVFVSGHMRSGTTFLYQLLAATDVFDYINNFVARFWKAPYVGKKLIDSVMDGQERGSRSSFLNDFGVTRSFYEPHAFTYFWINIFQHDHYVDGKPGAEQFDKIDKEHLLKELAALESLKDRPLLFRNGIFRHYMHFLWEKVPQTLFVFVEREPTYILQSMYILRLKMYGGLESRPGYFPQELGELDRLDPYEQIAGQVYYQHQETMNYLEKLPETSYVTISYEELCRDTHGTLGKIVTAAGLELPELAGIIPASFECGNKLKISRKDFLKLEKAAAKYFL